MTKRTIAAEHPSSEEKVEKKCASPTPTPPPLTSEEERDSLYDDMSIPIEKRARLKEQRERVPAGK